MNRTVRMALLAVFSVLAVPSFAQTTLSKADTWALDALSKMKKVGLLKNYPTGLFTEGKRLSRQEIAVATHAAFIRLETATQGLDSQKTKLDRVLNPTGEGSGVFTAEDIRQLRELLGVAGAASAELTAYAESAANLAKLTAEYEDELNALGVDVEAMKLTLSSLGDRIGRLEQNALPFELGVEFNLVSHLGHSLDRKFGVTVDGRPTGVSAGSPIFESGGSGLPRPVGITKDVNFGHELALHLSGDVGEIDWKAALAYGNLASGGGFIPGAYYNYGGMYGNKSQNQFGQPFQDGEPNFYFQELELAWKGNIARKDAAFRVGRIGYQANPWVFRRMDNTPYFDNERWDDHNWYFDGAHLSFPFRSGSRLDVTGGRHGERKGSSPAGFAGLWPMTVGEIEAASGIGSLDVEQHFGLGYWDHPCRHMNYNLSYTMFQGSNPVNFTGPRGDYNRMDVLGFNANYTLPCRKTLNFGFAESIYKNDDSTTMGSDNRAYWASLPWNKGRANGSVGWRQIDSNYGAPGDWGRVGPNWRAVDHKGWNAQVQYSASDIDKLSLDTYLYTGMAGDHNQFNRSEEMRGFTFDWWKKLSDTATLRTGYEIFESDDNGDRARFEWLRLGVQHDLGGDMFLNMLYELSNASAENGTRYRSFYGDRRRGGLLTFQFGQKY